MKCRFLYDGHYAVYEEAYAHSGSKVDAWAGSEVCAQSDCVIYKMPGATVIEGPQTYVIEYGADDNA